MYFWNSLWIAIKIHIIWEIMKTCTHIPWGDLFDFAVYLVINLWCSLKIDSNRTTWLKFTNSMNFKLLAYPYSWWYSVFQNRGLLLAISCNFWPKTNIAVFNADLVPVDPFNSWYFIADIKVFLLWYFTYLWHYFHSVLVTEQNNTSLFYLLSLFPTCQLFLNIFYCLAETSALALFCFFCNPLSLLPPLLPISAKGDYFLV